MQNFKFKYGRGEVDFSLPKEQIQHEIIGKDYPPLADITQAIRSALAKPIDSPPLEQIVKPGEKVVIAVSDVTRAWQQMDIVLPEVLAVLNKAGVQDEKITIIIAVGGHRQNTEAEFFQLCGKEICERVTVVNHDAFDQNNIVYLGTTSFGTEVSINKLVAEADRVILTGGIVFHYNAGFGGGRKSILPGISSIKTIRQNHLLGLGSEVGSGTSPNSASRKTKGNPLHEDMMEIAGFVQPDFIINMVPTPENRFAGVFAGNWVSAWMAGCELVEEIYGVKIEQLADIVIATSGGFPKDINLYQTGKTMDNALCAVKKGGAVIILSDCPDISEPPEFSQWFQYETKLAMEQALRNDFGIPGWVAFKEVECSDHATYILVTRKENADFVAKTGMIAVTTIEAALAIAQDKCGVDKPMYTLMPQGANTLPILR